MELFALMIGPSNSIHGDTVIEGSFFMNGGGMSGYWWSCALLTG